jgi:hypothetical protein
MADRGDDGKPGAHRPLGVVLVRVRIAEIDKHPVAYVLCNTKPSWRATVSAIER